MTIVQGKRGNRKTMQICPFCASPNIFYSKKRASWFCEDCDRGFDEPGNEKGMRIFISYGHDKNQELVTKIKDYLASQGYDVWIDTSCIPKGRDWKERITSGLMGSNGVLAFLSKHSVRSPGVCLDELRIALRLRHSYVKSILLEKEDDVRPPYKLTESQWIDMSDWETVPPEEWDEYFAGKMRELMEVLESDDAKKYTQEMDLISRRLHVTEGIAREQKLLMEEFVGRAWLTEQVNDWYENGDNSRMLIFGVPGAGKSAFAANLSRYSEDVAAALFLEWDNPVLQHADSVICRLAYKLAGSLHDYRRMLCSMLEDEKETEKKLEMLHEGSLFDWLVLEPVQLCIGGGRGRTLIIIDGLDETDSRIAHLLYTKAAKFPEWIRVLFTSRYDETALSFYSGAQVIRLDEQSEENSRDLQNYISSKLSVLEGASEALYSSIAEKSQGSFIYAKTLCEALLSGQVNTGEISSLPGGIKEFYFEFFMRLFSSPEEYAKVRPLFELMCVEEEVSEPVMRVCLGVDKYGMWEFRSFLKSLVISEIKKDYMGERRVLRFVHKSIGDWIQEPEAAGMFWADRVNGYRLLARTCEDVTEREPSETAEDGDDKKQIDYFFASRPRWLFKARMYDKYKQLLLASFDREEMKNHFTDYTYYYKYIGLWDWVEELPASYYTEDLAQTLTEIVNYPKGRMCSEFAHRSFQISAMLFKQILVNGRCREVFYLFMRQLQYARYFMSSASDMDGETRDGWDKFYMTRDVNLCVKKLEKLGFRVPADVLRQCNFMKLTFCYYRGSTEHSMFTCDDLLAEEGFFKDICILDDTAEKVFFHEVSETKAFYNTMSLQYYLTGTDEEDWEFIDFSVNNLADPPMACNGAEDAIREKYGSMPMPAGKTRRLAFIEEVRRRYS